MHEFPYCERQKHNKNISITLYYYTQYICNFYSLVQKLNTRVYNFILFYVKQILENILVKILILVYQIDTTIEFFLENTNLKHIFFVS